ncbi:ras guanine nucleotide exchange factor domain-containing protein [Gorgonomyces haynaldii]|nr:ras guanine nucleotide exchange factor domain-containing protein [Gorgonomyces haynaldii]
MADWTVGFYVKVQMPTGDTTVVLADENTSIYEVIKKVEQKKEMRLENGKAVVQCPDGKHLPSFYEQTLSNFRDIDKILVFGRVYSSQYPNGFDGNSPVDKKVSPLEVSSARSSTPGSPAGSEAGTPKSRQSPGKAKLKSLVTMFKKQPSGEFAPGSAGIEIPKSSVTLPTQRNSQQTSPASFNGSNPELAALPNQKPSRMSHAHGSKSMDFRELTQSHRESNQSLSGEPKELSKVFSQEQVEVRYSSVSRHSHQAPPLSPGPKSPYINTDTSFFSGPLPSPSLTTDSASIATAETVIAPNPPEDVKLSAEDQEKEDEVPDIKPPSPETQRIIQQRQQKNQNGRRRSKSNPVDSVVQQMQQRRLVVQTQPKEEEVKQIIFKVTFLDQTMSVLKMAGNCTMEQVCAMVCQHKDYDYASMTFDTGDKTQMVPVEMDRRLESYHKGGKPVDFFMVKRAKAYSSIAVTDNGQEVLSYHKIEGKIQVMLATPQKIFDILNDVNEDFNEDFVDTIILTFRNYTTPDQLLDSLIDRFNNPLAVDDATFDYKSAQQRRVLAIVHHWIENGWPDFGLSTPLRNRLNLFLQKLASDFKSDFTVLAQRLFTLAKNQFDEFEKLLEDYTLEELQEDNKEKKNAKFNISLLDKLTPTEICQNLCIHNYDIFKTIHPIEFLNEIWKKDNEASPSFRYFVDRFDRESYWVATELIMGDAATDQKMRIRYLAKFITIANECIQTNNFFSAFSIISGLNLTPVQRLKKTWEALPEKSKKEWEEVSKLADPSKNMKNYRDRLATATSPMVPFLPIYLKDLTFINDGNQNKIRGLVNVDKLRMMAGRVLEIIDLGESAYSFPKNPPALNYVSKPPINRNQEDLKKRATAIENQ